MATITQVFELVYPKLAHSFSAASTLMTLGRNARPEGPLNALADFGTIGTAFAQVQG